MLKTETYKELLEFIINDQRDLTQEEISRRIGFASKTMYSILNGVEPGKRVRRLLKGFVENKYGVTVSELSSGKIQVVKKQIFNISGDYVGGNLSEDFEATKTVAQKEKGSSNVQDYLLKKVMILEEELLKCKQENDILKSKIT